MTMRLARLVVFALAVSVAWSSLALESDPLPVPKGSPREHAIGLYNDGVLLMLQKHYAAAQGKFEAAIALHEPLAEAHNNLAFSLRVQGRANLDRALAHYNRAIALKPDLHVAYMYRGALHVRRGDLVAARADHARLVAAAPRLAVLLERVMASGVDADDYHGLAGQYD